MFYMSVNVGATFTMIFVPMIRSKQPLPLSTSCIFLQFSKLGHIEDFAKPVNLVNA